METTAVAQTVCSYEECRKRVFTSCDQCGQQYCSDHVRLRGPRKYLCFVCAGEPAPVIEAPAEAAASSSQSYGLLGFGLGCLPLGIPIFLTFSGWHALSLVFESLPVWIILYVCAWVGAIVLFIKRFPHHSRSLAEGLMIGLVVTGALALIVTILIVRAFANFT